MMIVLASSNQGKLREIKALLAPLDIEVRTARDMGFTQEVEETGATFEENAALKACAVAQALGVPALADDSGLSVDHLQGAPGVHSARYAGPGASDQEKNAKLLREMQGVPREKRSCAFVCAMCLCTPEGDRLLTSGRLEGEIAMEPEGDQGFGYDPIFWLPSRKLMVAELDKEAKNSISHRGQALREMVNKLPAFIQVRRS